MAAGGDGDDGDDVPPGMRIAEHGSSDAGPPRLPHVAAGSSTTKTTRNPDWCSSSRSPKRLSP